MVGSPWGGALGFASGLALLGCSGSTTVPGPSTGSDGSGGTGTAEAVSSGGGTAAGTGAEGGGGGGGAPAGAVTCTAGFMESSCTIWCTREGELVIRAGCAAPPEATPGGSATLECSCMEGPRAGETFTMPHCNDPTETVVRECG
ncbi:hypothetical protein BE08_38665 [Sorangium cellulosum]|uniref:Uncharacterized protein n=1 Tax=Sorangium cellulosum TaxID=56 RepID=A0A150PR50_SORCE|nr:hypothetical protein BE08_38665 [Sorangium cellulosum]